MQPTFGAYLSRLRHEANLSRADLAAHIGVSEQTVRRWEQDWHLPRYATFVALMAVLVTSAEIECDAALAAGKGRD